VDAPAHRPRDAPDELPVLDAIVLSHLHGDHWDRVARRELDRGQPVLTTTHAAPRLRRQGFTTVGLDTWEDRVLDRPGSSCGWCRCPASMLEGRWARCCRR
jgi:L-ascorbate metabolism protein UlaG (beta-lactamase superfamily)